MKIQVITDTQGNIVAMAPMVKATGEDAPAQVSMAVEKDRLIHEFDVNDDFLKLRPEEVHHRFRVDLRAGAKLIDIAEHKGSKC